MIYNIKLSTYSICKIINDCAKNTKEIYVPNFPLYTAAVLCSTG